MTGSEETRPEKVVKRRLLRRDIEEFLTNVVSEREGLVLRLRFGLVDGEGPLTCEEIARRLRLSRERVRQIYNIAMSKLKLRTSVVNSLRFYIDP